MFAILLTAWSIVVAFVVGVVVGGVVVFLVVGGGGGIVTVLVANRAMQLRLALSVVAMGQYAWVHRPW